MQSIRPSRLLRAVLLWFVLTIVLLFWVGLMVFVAGSPARATPIADVVAATYKVYLGDRPICSGQFVKSTATEDLFLTAGHCMSFIPASDIKQLKTLNVRRTIENAEFDTISEHTYYLRPVRQMIKRDLVLFQTTDPSGEFKTVEIATVEETNKALVIGAPLVVVGYPKMMELTYTTGEFTGRVKFPDDEFEGAFYRATVPVTGGSSGGGIYLKTVKDGVDDYKLIGATTAGFRDVSFMNYYSTVEAVNELVKGFLAPAPVAAMPAVTPVKASLPSSDALAK